MRSCCVIADLPHAAHWSYVVFPEPTQVIQALPAQRTKQLRRRCVRQWRPELGPEDSNTNSHKGGSQPWRIDAVRTAEDEPVVVRFRKDLPNLQKGPCGAGPPPRRRQDRPRGPPGPSQGEPRLLTLREPGPSCFRFNVQSVWRFGKEYNSTARGRISADHNRARYYDPKPSRLRTNHEKLILLSFAGGVTELLRN
jgi:hypothetical protein